jgi:hypothetical protein
LNKTPCINSKTLTSRTPIWWFWTVVLSLISITSLHKPARYTVVLELNITVRIKKVGVASVVVVVVVVVV